MYIGYKEVYAGIDGYSWDIMVVYGQICVCGYL